VCTPLQLYSVRDLLRTSVEHIAYQISRAVSTQYITNDRGNGVTAESNSRPLRLLATGGGCHNTFLLRRLGEVLTTTMPHGAVIEPGGGSEELTVDFKEAVVFAFLGLRCVLGLVNIDSAVTGSALDTISGAIHLGVDRSARCGVFHDEMAANLRKSSNAVVQRDTSSMLPHQALQRRRTSSVSAGNIGTLK